MLEHVYIYILNATPLYSSILRMLEYANYSRPLPLLMGLAL